MPMWQKGKIFGIGYLNAFKMYEGSA